MTRLTLKWAVHLWSQLSLENFQELIITVWEADNVVFWVFFPRSPALGGYWKSYFKRLIMLLILLALPKQPNISTSISTSITVAMQMTVNMLQSLLLSPLMGHYRHPRRCVLSPRQYNNLTNTITVGSQIKVWSRPIFKIHSSNDVDQSKSGINW